MNLFVLFTISNGNDLSLANMETVLIICEPGWLTKKPLSFCVISYDCPTVSLDFP